MALKWLFLCFKAKSLKWGGACLWISMLIAHNENQKYLEDWLLWLTRQKRRLLFRAQRCLVVGGWEEQRFQERPYVLREGGECYLLLRLHVSADPLLLHLLLPPCSCCPWGWWSSAQQAGVKDELGAGAGGEGAEVSCFLLCFYSSASEERKGFASCPMACLVC